MPQTAATTVPVLFFRVGQLVEIKTDYKHLIPPHSSAPADLVRAVTETHARLARSLYELPEEFCFVYPHRSEVDYTVACLFSRVTSGDDRPHLQMLAVAGEVETLSEAGLDPMQFANGVAWGDFENWKPFKNVPITAARGGSTYAPWAELIAISTDGRVGGEEWDGLDFGQKCITLSMAIRRLPEEEWYANAYAVNAPGKAELLRPAPRLAILRAAKTSPKAVVASENERLEDAIPVIWSANISDQQKVLFILDVRDMRLLEKACLLANKDGAKLAGALKEFQTQSGDLAARLRARGCGDAADRLSSFVSQRTQYYDGILGERKRDEKQILHYVIVSAAVSVVAVVVIVLGLRLYVSRLNPPTAATHAGSGGNVHGGSSGASTKTTHTTPTSPPATHVLIDGKSSSLDALAKRDMGHPLIIEMVNNLDDARQVDKIVALTMQYKARGVLAVVLSENGTLGGARKMYRQYGAKRLAVACGPSVSQLIQNQEEPGNPDLPQISIDPGDGSSPTYIDKDNSGSALKNDAQLLFAPIDETGANSSTQ